MNGFLRGSLLAALLGIALALAGCGGGGGSGNTPGASAPNSVVQPLPLPVPMRLRAATSSRISLDWPPGEDVTSYWKGMPSDSGTPRYVTDLLGDPDNTLIATVTAPQDSTLYGEFVGQQVQFVVIVCYPTTADNPRPDYPLNPPQTDRVVPHMQTGSDRAFICGRLGSLSGGCVFAWLPGQPDQLRRLHAGAVRLRELRLRSHRPVSRRPALFQLHDRQSRRRHCRGVAPGKLHGDAGTASAFDIRGARPRSRASAMERSHR